MWARAAEESVCLHRLGSVFTLPHRNRTNTPQFCIRSAVCRPFHAQQREADQREAGRSQLDRPITSGCQHQQQLRLDSPKLGGVLCQVGLALLLPSQATAAVHAEPGNALSLQTWAIHISSVLEWITAMSLFWRYADVTGQCLPALTLKFAGCHSERLRVQCKRCSANISSLCQQGSL